MRNYAEEIKTSAQTIIDKADSIINDNDLWTSVNITIHLDVESTATIITTKEEISKKVIDYYTNNT